MNFMVFTVLKRLIFNTSQAASTKARRTLICYKVIPGYLKLLTLAVIFISPTSFALQPTGIADASQELSRQQMLALCSQQAKSQLRAEYIIQHPEVELVYLTTWLSAELIRHEIFYQFTHIAKVQLADGRLMHWDFRSLTSPNYPQSSCQLLELKKNSERFLPPPEDCDPCDEDNGD